MKQNLIIILLTAVVMLLLVNVYVGQYPPVVHASGTVSGGEGFIDCATSVDHIGLEHAACATSLDLLFLATKRDVRRYCRH